MEELQHPLLKVPFEKANKSFRLFHKHITREVVAVNKSIHELREEQSPAQHAVIAETIQRLQVIADRINDMKADAKKFITEQNKGVETCVLRTQYIQDSVGMPIGRTSAGGDEKDTASEKQVHANPCDRLIADYLLCKGYTKSSTIVQEEKGVDFLVDNEVHLECRGILNDLHGHNVSTAIAWCIDNASRLRRLRSILEFHLRLQDFVELVRSDKKLDAIQYAQSFLTPLSLQHEDGEVKQSMMESIQEAMATLAYKSPHQCGVESYSRLFSPERWERLKELFRSTFCEVYGIHNPPSLCIALHAGMSTLNTRACRRTRDARDAIKRERSCDYEGDSAESNYETSENKRQIESSTSQRNKKTKIDGPGCSSSPSSAQIRNLKGTRVGATEEAGFEDFTPNCPACSEYGRKLCRDLPFAHHPHSRLICRVTQQVMDEHNPPLVLPNGYVYSQQAIDVLTKQQSSSDGMVTCPETQEMYSITDFKPVYIL